MRFPTPFWLIAVLAPIAALGCGRPTGVPDSSSSGSQRVPFDRESRSSGISPSQTLIPATGRLPEGTSLTIRLGKALTSASAHAGDNLEGALDEPIMVDEQTLIAQGAKVTGRVLDAKHAEGPRSPGYLRIALVSVDNGGKPVLIETSSIFVKGGAHEERATANSGAPVSSKDVVLATDRRLTFRLAQPALLQ